MPVHIDTKNSNNDHDSLFCPICGTDTYESLSAQQTPCAHVAYVFFDDISEFDQVSPTISNLVDEITKEDMAQQELMQQIMQKKISMTEYTELAHPVIRLEQKIDALFPRNTFLHLGITTYGMACGPMSSTIHIGYDFGAE